MESGACLEIVRKRIEKDLITTHLGFICDRKW